MFSIADLDNAQPDAFENEEEGEQESPESLAPSASFPIRCAFSITKVSNIYVLHETGKKFLA